MAGPSGLWMRVFATARNAEAGADPTQDLAPEVADLGPAPGHVTASLGPGLPLVGKGSPGPAAGPGPGDLDPKGTVE
jgi:hypothetical protein